MVGYMAAFLLTDEDRDAANALYNVEHLLELWEEIHARAAATRLWLIGSPSAALRARCLGRDDIRLFGLLPREQALAHAAAFDIALYPARRIRAFGRSRSPSTWVSAYRRSRTTTR